MRAEARARQFEASMRDLDAWREWFRKEYELEAAAAAAEARNARNARGVYRRATEEQRKREEERRREMEEREGEKRWKRAEVERVKRQQEEIAETARTD
jgi:hypothetical protein